MPPTKRKRGLKFSQLSKAAKERAMEDWRISQWDSHNSDSITELLTSDLEELHGITGVELHWSLSHCQGDGVEFHGLPSITKMAEHDDELRGMLAEANMMLALQGHECDGEWVPNLIYERHHCGGGDIYVTITVEHDADWPGIDELDERCARMEAYLKERYRAICCELAETGYAEIDYQDSEECIAELCEANDYRFTRDGEML